MIRSLIAIVRIMISVILLLAAVLKIRRYSEFRQSVTKLTFLSNDLAAVVAILVLVAEFLVGATLLTGLWPIVSGCAAFALFAAFTGVLTATRMRSSTQTCNCLGFSKLITWASVMRTGSLACLSLAIAAVVYPRTLLAIGLGVMVASWATERLVGSGASNHEMHLSLPKGETHSRE